MYTPYYTAADAGMGEAGEAILIQGITCTEGLVCFLTVGHGY